MPAKYYEIIERFTDCVVGVIEIKDGEDYPYDKIQEAIELHLDEEVNVLSIETVHEDLGFEIPILRDFGLSEGQVDVDDDPEIFDAKVTQLFF